MASLTTDARKKVTIWSDQYRIGVGKDTGGKCEKWRAHKPKECKGMSDTGTKREGDQNKNDNKDNKNNSKNVFHQNFK